MIAFTPSVYMYIHGEPIKLAIIYIMIVWRLVSQGNDPWILNMYIYNYIYDTQNHSEVRSRKSLAWRVLFGLEGSAVLGGLAGWADWLLSTAAPALAGVATGLAAWGSYAQRWIKDNPSSFK